MVKVLIISTTDSIRSQMVRGFLQDYARKRASIYSAGLKKGKVDPYVKKVMDEVNIDISNQESSTLDKYDTLDFDYVITISDEAKNNLPYLPISGLLVHQHIEAPSKIKGDEEATLDEYRWTRYYADTLAHKFSKVHFKGLRPELRAKELSS